MQQSFRFTVLLAVLIYGAFGQSLPAKHSFEVASVKVNITNIPNEFVPHRSGDRVTMLNTTLEAVVTFAYHIANPSYQLAGEEHLQLPYGWNWYDIEAVAPGSPADDDLRLMFQDLLEDRFKLKLHRETRELTQYDLVVAKGGSKLKAANPENKIGTEGRFISEGRSMIGMFNDGAHLMGKGASMEQLVAALSGRMRAPVRDRTGLSGTFDYNVAFARDDNAADLTGPAPLTTAIQQQLGLKLESGKGPVEVLVIDHVEKPSAN